MKLGKEQLVYINTISKDRAWHLLKLVKADTCFDCILCGYEMGILAAYHAGMISIMIPDIVEPSEEIDRLVYRLTGNLGEQ